MWEVTDLEAQRLIAINGDLITDATLEHYKTLAPIYYEMACDYCNATLEITESAMLIFVAKAIQFYTQKAGLTARSMGSVSYSYATDLPSSVLKSLKPFKKLRW
ncbi:hypothetical protein M3603_05765 [Rummeliibacillus stabekisii]|uniref:hypothetical protein n=1 Tax=Rummeliibacillus stabekisii TaxID=241244 RepID=UPI00203DB6E1|nr:hypothetical protein [Rummeliibacillus stabekisii]MCM3316179.1 hypothetical protein [Rummeliibacillus stabekisii]